MSIRQAVDHLRQNALHSAIDAMHFFIAQSRVMRSMQFSASVLIKMMGSDSDNVRKA